VNDDDDVTANVDERTVIGDDIANDYANAIDRVCAMAK
jgi:hypothetical protein